jgi:hypothetical protein
MLVYAQDSSNLGYSASLTAHWSLIFVFKAVKHYSLSIYSFFVWLISSKTPSASPLPLQVPACLAQGRKHNSLQNCQKPIRFVENQLVEI